jgi:predicted TIM-barrel fold metal-dependent hydrolase
LVIDIHAHIFPDQLAKRALDRLVQNLHDQEPDIDPNAPYTDATAAGLTKSAKSAGVDISVIMPIATSAKSSQTLNSFAAYVDKLPGLRSFGSVHPNYPDALKELETVKSLGLRGIKLHPEYQQSYPDSPETIALVRRAAELDLWVLFHAGADIGLPPPVHGTPARFARLCSAVPDAKIILAHMGGFRMWEEAESIYINSRVYLDTSFSLDIHPEESERFARLIRQIGTDRVLFGTDSPWADQKTVLQLVRSFLSQHNFTQLECDAILGKNAARILGLNV